jgi:hypothetical protein
VLARGAACLDDRWRCDRPRQVLAVATCSTYAVRRRLPGASSGTIGTPSNAVPK